jgi:hypothetical protein
MSQDEINTQDARVRALYATGSREDHITAILMDVTISGSGYPEATARKKAKAILKMI